MSFMTHDTLAAHPTREYPVRRASALLQASGVAIMRYGLALVILWFGIFKFTPSEALAIEPLVRNSPLLSWMYSLSGIRGVSAMIGTIEIAIALLMLTRARWPGASAVGSIGAVGMFATTLSFLVTTPGSWAWVETSPRHLRPLAAPILP